MGSQNESTFYLYGTFSRPLNFVNANHCRLKKLCCVSIVWFGRIHRLDANSMYVLSDESSCQFFFPFLLCNQPIFKDECLNDDFESTNVRKPFFFLFLVTGSIGT